MLNLDTLTDCGIKGEQAGRDAAQHHGTPSFRGAFQYFDEKFPEIAKGLDGERNSYRSYFTFAFLEALEKALGRR
jgi:hypothetical protein